MHCLKNYSNEWMKVQWIAFFTLRLKREVSSCTLPLTTVCLPLYDSSRHHLLWSSNSDCRAAAPFLLRDTEVPSPHCIAQVIATAKETMHSFHLMLCLTWNKKGKINFESYLLLLLFQRMLDYSKHVFMCHWATIIGGWAAGCLSVIVDIDHHFAQWLVDKNNAKLWRASMWRHFLSELMYSPE